MIARHGRVVLDRQAVAIFPLVEFAGAQAQPLQQLPRGEFRPPRPVAKVIDNFVAGVMGNPASF
jgi:hypothetical protein